MSLQLKYIKSEMKFGTTSYCNTRGPKSNKILHIYIFKIIYVVYFYVVCFMF